MRVTARRNEKPRSYETIARLGPAVGPSTVQLARQIHDDGMSSPLVLVFCSDADEWIELLFEESAWWQRLLDHPHLVELVDAGTFDDDVSIAADRATYRTAARTSPRARFVALEAQNAMTLGALARHGALPPREVAALGAQVAFGLAHLHELRTEAGQALDAVHASVEPDTILVTRDGIARLVAPLLVDLKRLRAPRRELAYLAPERARGDRCDARCDQFALGAVLWEAVVGRPLFRRESDLETIRAIIAVTGEPAGSAALANAAVPAAFDEVLGTLLSPRPEDRYPSVRDAGRALERLAQRNDASEPASTALASRVRSHVAPASSDGFWPTWLGAS